MHDSANGIFDYFCVSWQVKMLYFEAYLVLPEFNMTITNSVLRAAQTDNLK